MEARHQQGISGETLELSVVAPCYNEEVGIGEFVRRTVAVCEQTACSYEILLVDDGSQDGTWERIREAAAQHPAVRGIRLSRNHGHQLALTAGLAWTRGAQILIIDADLQDPPELLAEMLQLMEKTGADVVYGQRRVRQGETRFKLMTAFLFYRLLNWLSEIEIPRDTGDFRLMKRCVLNVLLEMPEQHRFIRGMVAWIGFHQIPMLYDRQERVCGKSHYPFLTMLRFALNAITSFSVRPLRIASVCGMIIALICLVAEIYAVASKFYGHAVPGWTSLMVVVFFAASLQLFVLGIIGEYLGRMFIEIKRRPLYVIREVTNMPPRRKSAP